LSCACLRQCRRNDISADARLRLVRVLHAAVSGKQVVDEISLARVHHIREEAAH
jgi:hypothetical protein